VSPLLFSIFEGNKQKRNLLLKERKLSAVKLVSAGENKSVKKQSLTWKSRILLFQSPYRKSEKVEKAERSKAGF
jgi:hypothetical protein